MKKLTRILAFAVMFLSGNTIAQPVFAQSKPTIVLVHGAFADSSSWNEVISRLKRDGYKAIAAANPLRGVMADAATVSAVIRSISGPVVLVGHSYGGPVITEAANGNPNVTALVYVSAFTPDRGETSLGLSNKFPGSTLADAIFSVEHGQGAHDLFIRLDRFHDQFAADLSEDQSTLMAATQRPVAQAALEEKSGSPSWKRLPSYSIYGSQDRNIPPAAMEFMAKRAGTVKTVVIDGASHVVMISHPEEVAGLIEEAASVH
jgi:pimeloyl-ACP methyl ester carboxylesterase